MAKDHPALVPSVLQMKCPNCRKGQMFTNKSIFPLGKLLDMPERCPVCGQKLELEVGFYYGTGYVSYGLSVALYVFNLVWYWLIFGLSFHDNSMISYFVTSTVIVVLLQPWLMRISRVLYLNMFVKYGKGTRLKSQQ
ncbi:MAG: DUF983 domain-containing protein [Taibaiella sp.]|nr:DUF983 domain-containing protein [Taibaiella sp.]